jgi:hypothetical protein
LTGCCAAAGTVSRAKPSAKEDAAAIDRGNNMRTASNVVCLWPKPRQARETAATGFSLHEKPDQGRAPPMPSMMWSAAVISSRPQGTMSSLRRRPAVEAMEIAATGR